MGHEEVWNALNDLIMEFKRKGGIVPPKVISDLRAAKTLMHVLRVDPTKKENVPTIDMYLGKVESHLIFEAQAVFGSEFMNRWMRKLREAREKRDVEVPAATASKFVPGLPKGESWLRVQVSRETSREDIERSAEESGLASRMQEDGYMLVHGDEGKLKRFVKRMASRVRPAE